MSLPETSVLAVDFSLQERYQKIRQTTEAICSPLSKEDYVPQPIEDVSPPKWHLGHTTWFFENFILAEYVTGFKLFNPSFNYLFNSYYESQGDRILRSNRGNLSRPTVDEIYEYRAYVDQHMSAFIESGISQELTDLLEVGLQHEQQHQELLVTDIKYILGNNPLFPSYTTQLRQSPTDFIQEAWVTINEGMYTIGHDTNNFCFDNELNQHQVFIPAFQLRNTLVTNEEYLEFIHDEGYSKAELWLSEGWIWVKANQIEAPEYWYQKGNEWYYYTLHGLQKVDLKEPVTHISYYEADAFARWKGYRLPTEFEWEAACRLIAQPINDRNNFLESGYFHSRPAIELNNDFLGNVWEWTSSAYLPYPNYPQYKGALGEYNGKFMINQMVLRGGSCATPKSHIRPSYRNFFHADKRWQFTGIRLVNSIIS